jgi:hypothetical protein
MAEPSPRPGTRGPATQGPETGGRSLADILREAGIENPTKTGRRRRWDDMDDTGTRQRRPDAGDAPAPRDTGYYGRRASDLPLERTLAPREGGERRAQYPRQESDLRREQYPRPETDLRREREREPRRQRDERPREDRRAPEDRRAAQDRRAPEDRRTPEQRRGEDRGRPPRAARTAVPEPSTAAIPGLRPSRTPSVPGGPSGAPAAPAEEPAPQRRGGRGERMARGDRRVVEPAPLTGPIPPVGDDVSELSDDAGPRESALAWLRFGGELVIAAAVGVGIYFAFTVLWQMLPHLAVLVAPLAVTGLVAGVGMWRQRLGHAQLGARLLAVLVFAGTLLTVLPAAGLITGR